MITADPKSISFENLPQLVAKADVYLYLTKRWMEWADGGAGDAKVIGTEASPTPSLKVSFSGGLFGAEKIPYDNRMKFIVKKKGGK